MKIFGSSFLFLSKFKANQTKLPYFFSLRRKCSALYSHLCLSSQCYLSVSNSFKVNCVAHKHGKVAHKHGKLYTETENEYAHTVMENISVYSNSLLKHPLSVDTCISHSKQFNDFTNAIDEFFKITVQNISEGLLLENCKFTDIVKKVISELIITSDENLEKILYHLCLWPLATRTTAPNFKTLWNILDHECVSRLDRWNVSRKLLIADYWFHLKLSRISRYNTAVIFNLVKDIETLSNHEVIQLMFYINLQRKIPDVFVLSLEKKIESIVRFLTPEELGIICLGFFKTQNRISSITLLQSIIKQFMSSIENVNTVTVAAVLKFLRKSMNLSLIDSYILILHKCIPYINNFDVPTSVHLALLASECNVYHPLLLTCVSEKLIKEMSNVRMKDYAKFLMSVSLYNHFEQNFHDAFFEDLKKERRQQELGTFPKQTLHCVLAYAYMGHYNYKLIDKIFKKEFVQKAVIHDSELCVTYAELDYCLEIECPDYTGARLATTARNILQHRRGNIPVKSQHKNMQIRLIGEVYETIVEILGSDKSVHIRHILPHLYTPDIIVSLSGSITKPLSDFCQEFPPEVILKPPVDEIWAALVVCSTYSFAHKTTHMTGITAMKLRQLDKLGYRVAFIPYFNVSRKISLRKIFLKEKLNMLEENVKQIPFQ